VSPSHVQPDKADRPGQQTERVEERKDDGHKKTQNTQKENQCTARSIGQGKFRIKARLPLRVCPSMSVAINVFLCLFFASFAFLRGKQMGHFLARRGWVSF
jgi:hypothetical protein